MTYAIIGSGTVGATLANLFARRNIPATIANSRGPETMVSLVKDLGRKIRPVTMQDALSAEVILLAVPFLKVADVGSALKDWGGKIVIDITNAFNVPPEVLNGRLSTEIVASLFPGAMVVKAFNQLPFGVLAREIPKEDGGRRVIFLSSNHEAASKKVSSLIDSLGFSPIDLGKINEGGVLIQARNNLVFRNLIEHSLK